jgi:hypothetical protein
MKPWFLPGAVVVTLLACGVQYVVGLEFRHDQLYSGTRLAKQFVLEVRLAALAANAMVLALTWGVTRRRGPVLALALLMLGGCVTGVIHEARSARECK